MTFRRTSKLLLISILSFAWIPSVLTSDCFSEPAKSTSWNLLTVTFIICFISWASTVNEKIPWLRLENSLSWWDARILFWDPNLKSLSASSALWHSNTYKFSTTNWSFYVHLIRRPVWSFAIEFVPTVVWVRRSAESPPMLLGFSKSNTFSL